jgi:hypothetical protein
MGLRVMGYVWVRESEFVFWLTDDDVDVEGAPFKEQVRHEK